MLHLIRFDQDYHDNDDNNDHVCDNDQDNDLDNDFDRGHVCAHIPHGLSRCCPLAAGRTRPISAN